MVVLERCYICDVPKICETMIFVADNCLLDQLHGDHGVDLIKKISAIAILVSNIQVVITFQFNMQDQDQMCQCLYM